MGSEQPFHLVCCWSSIEGHPEACKAAFPLMPSHGTASYAVQARVDLNTQSVPGGIEQAAHIGGGQMRRAGGRTRLCGITKGGGTARHRPDGWTHPQAAETENRRFPGTDLGDINATRRMETCEWSTRSAIPVRSCG